MFARALGAAALLLAAGACKSSIHKTVAAADGLQVSAVAVYPFGFRWDEPAYRSFELSQRLLSVATRKAGDSVVFFGPSEFEVRRAGEDHAWVGSTAVALLPPMGIRPDQGLVMRAWAERRDQRGQKEILNSKGKAVAIAGTEETTFIGHLELIHPSSGKVLVEISGETKVDPFAERDDDEEADPTPELTALMSQLTEAAFEALDDQLKAVREPKELKLSLAFNPQIAFTYTEGGRPPLQALVSKMDALEADVLENARIRYANPGLPDPETARLARLPGGLYVLAPTPDGKLQQGDLITQIDGQPALPQAIHRLSFSDAPVQARVRRANGQEEELVLP
jgi:hypothetical protein